MAKRYEFTGKAEYCKPYPDQLDTKFQNANGGKWSTNLILDDASMEVWKSLKTRNKTDGNKVLNISRRERGYFGDLGAPKVELPVGVAEGALIGNGSDVTVTVEVYPLKDKSGNAARWEEVRVLELVEYIPNEVVVVTPGKGLPID